MKLPEIKLLEESYNVDCRFIKFIYFISFREFAGFGNITQTLSVESTV